MKIKYKNIPILWKIVGNYLSKFVFSKKIVKNKHFFLKSADKYKKICFIIFLAIFPSTHILI